MVKTSDIETSQSSRAAPTNFHDLNSQSEASVTKFAEAVERSPLFRLPHELRDKIYVLLAASTDLPDDEAIKSVGFRGGLYNIDMSEQPATVRSAKHSSVAFLTTCRMIQHEFSPVMLRYVPLKLSMGLQSQLTSPKAQLLTQIRNVEITINITERVDLLGLLCKRLTVLRSLEKPEMCHIRLNCYNQGFGSNTRIEDLPSRLLKMLGEIVRRFKSLEFSTKHCCSGYHVSPIPGPPRYSSHLAHQAMMDAVQREMDGFHGEIVSAEGFVDGERTKRLVFRSRVL